MNMAKTKYFIVILWVAFSFAMRAQTKVIDLKSDEVKQFPLCENSNLTYEKGEDKRLFANCIDRKVMLAFSYPKEAIEKNIQGKILVHYIIDKNGKIIVEKVEGEAILAAEGRRIFESFPTFSPAKNHNNEPIAVKGIYPINFKLQQ